MKAGRAIDAGRFASEDRLQVWCDHLGSAGYRGTGTATHDRIISWIEDELGTVPGLTIRDDRYDVLRWEPIPTGDLVAAGRLAADGRELPIAGAVPYTRPAAASGEVVHLPPGTAITDATAAGKIVVRDFPSFPLPYDGLLGLALHTTPDLDDLRGGTWDRPGLADGLLHDDLLAAGAAGAAGVVIAFDLPREQVAGYYEPHKGTHYRVPAVFVGAAERARLLAASGAPAEIGVNAAVSASQTRNLVATLPGQTPERIILVTHTDGNTWVQENGVAALLALAHSFAAVPIEHRRRTIEFAFTSAHLHISREGAARYAAQLDEEYDHGTIAFVFPIEHLGARELVPGAAEGERRLSFTGGIEPVLWAVGPSPALQTAVVDAVVGRGVERVLIAPGLSGPVEDRVPRIASFGGLGTHFHQHLLPTTSIITGPWSLWAPSFGADAIDIGAYRRQTLAAGDVVAALDGVAREEIAGGYLADRAARAAGTPSAVDSEPPEVA